MDFSGVKKIREDMCIGAKYTQRYKNWHMADYLVEEYYKRAKFPTLRLREGLPDAEVDFSSPLTFENGLQIYFKDESIPYSLSVPHVNATQNRADDFYEYRAHDSSETQVICDLLKENVDRFVAETYAKATNVSPEAKEVAGVIDSIIATSRKLNAIEQKNIDNNRIISRPAGDVFNFSLMGESLGYSDSKDSVEFTMSIGFANGYAWQDNSWIELTLGIDENNIEDGVPKFKGISMLNIYFGADFAVNYVPGRFISDDGGNKEKLDAFTYAHGEIDMLKAIDYRFKKYVDEVKKLTDPLVDDEPKVEDKVRKNLLEMPKADATTLNGSQSGLVQPSNVQVK
ncbi:MAG: hypothetical protein LBM38_05770 [Clostridiales bacterium]|nr:hypothetical protein [Clostridiales bacterium]